MPLRDGDRPAVVGHRGAPRAAPENTLAAFRAAAAAGATWVELDVRRSADGLVVTHDPCTPDAVPVVAQTTAALAAAGIASLEDVLDGLPTGLGVDVELKNLPGEPDDDPEDRIAAATAPLLRRAARQRPLFASSFNPSTLLALAFHAPDVPSGLLFASTLRAPVALELAVELGARVLCAPDGAPGLDEGVVASAHDAGLTVMVWTVDDPRRARTLAADGVDAICTNDPAALVAALHPSGDSR